jgi:hypothetical protein
MKDLGPAKLILGMRIERVRTSFTCLKRSILRKYFTSLGWTIDAKAMSYPLAAHFQVKHQAMAFY